MSFELHKRDKKARLRALCAAKGYHMDDLPGGWAYRLIQLDIGHAIHNAKRSCSAFSLDEAIYYLRFRAGTQSANLLATNEMH